MLYFAHGEIGDGAARKHFSTWRVRINELPSFEPESKV
jgi:hypothetical protein